jgi:hypothetical protein
MLSKGRSEILIEQDEIKEWAEERGAKPCSVKGTGDSKEAGVLRFDFPGVKGEGTLEPISWEEFFKRFDENDLALLVQEETASGEISNFNKFISRESAKRRAA